jgi:hypothetical protein
MPIEITLVRAAEESAECFRNALQLGCEVTDEEERAYRNLCAALETGVQDLCDIPRVVIHVEGGLVQQVIADRDIEVLVVDYDNEEAEQAEAEYSGQQWKPDRSWGNADTVDPVIVETWAEGREQED